jgi:cyanate lyase
VRDLAFRRDTSPQVGRVHAVIREWHHLAVQQWIARWDVDDDGLLTFEEIPSAESSKQRFLTAGHIYWFYRFLNMPDLLCG